MLCSTSGLTKDPLALQEAATNQEDEEATADMQEVQGVAFYWDGGDYVKTCGAAWFENTELGFGGGGYTPLQTACI
jgi:hypothetical protein